MPFTLERFQILRPWLFHLTAKRNVARIMDMRQLLPAATLMRQARQAQLIRTRRRTSVEVQIGDCVVHIRDQAVLHKGNTDLPDVVSFERFVEELNSRVFFWPGSDAAPIPPGLRHFKRYASEACKVIAIPTSQLFLENTPTPPEFCRFNSGSPRCSQGNRAPRGDGTFLPSHEFEETPGKVVEVTFRAPVLLPKSHLRVLNLSQFT